MDGSQRNLTVNAELLAGCTRALFWVLIVWNIAELLTLRITDNGTDRFYVPRELLKTAATVIYGILLLRLASESPRYRIAAVCWFINAAGSAVQIPLSAGESAVAVLNGMINLGVSAAMLTGTYHECAGHSDVLLEADGELSDKWLRLWKWYVRFLLILIGGIFLGAVIPAVGMLTLIAAVAVSLIIAIVLSVLKLIYLYKMSKIFQTYSKA